MYRVNILTNEDYVRKYEPTEYKNIRTASFTTARILLTDDNNHMYTIRPGSVKCISVNIEEVLTDAETIL